MHEVKMCVVGPRAVSSLPHYLHLPATSFRAQPCCNCRNSTNFLHHGNLAGRLTFELSILELGSCNFEILPPRSTTVKVLMERTPRTMEEL